MSNGVLFGLHFIAALFVTSVILYSILLIYLYIQSVEKSILRLVQLSIQCIYFQSALYNLRYSGV